jgi:hypothetical protein
LTDSQPEHAPATAAPIEARPVAARARVRPWAALILAGCLAVLLVALYLKPDPRGYGTHQRLIGMGPCGMLVMTGLPCPTCGMTTAFAHTVRGQWGRAFWVQPLGFLLALGTIGLAPVALWSLVRGRWPRVDLRVVTPLRLFVGLLVLLVGSWAFKIATGLADGTLPFR